MEHTTIDQIHQKWKEAPLHYITTKPFPPPTKMSSILKWMRKNLINHLEITIS